MPDFRPHVRGPVALLLFMIALGVLTPAVDGAIPRRGLYVSIDEPYPLAADPKFADLIGRPDRQEALYLYCRQHGFDALSLYNLQRILPARAADVRAMIRRARLGGIRWVEAIGGSVNSKWTDVADYQRACVSDDEMFDGMVTEIEYWQSVPKNVSEMLAPVVHTRALNPPGRTDPVTGARRPFYYAAYIGWPDVGQISHEMAAVLDAVYMHSYRRTPADAYAYTQARMSELLANSSLTAVVIYSSEGTTNASASLNPFMGDWLAASVNNTVQVAEQAYLQDLDAAFPLKAANATRVWGFQWFLYYYSGHYDTYATSRGPWLASDPSVTWPLVRAGSEWQNAAWCGEHQGANIRCQNLSLVNVSHDVVFVDMFDTTAATIASLKPRRHVVNATSTSSLPNRTVVCYYSAGTWENWRPDKGNFSAGSLRGPMSGWPGEQWLDLFNATAVAAEIKPAMLWRLDLAKSKGCDAVEPDNVDCWQNSACRLGATTATGKAVQLEYNRWTAAAAHARGLAVGLKNDLEQIVELVDDYDFAVNENCHQYTECGMLLPFLRADKAVFRTEYVSTLAAVCRDQDALALGPLHSTMRAVDGLWVPCSARPLNLSGSVGAGAPAATPATSAGPSPQSSTTSANVPTSTVAATGTTTAPGSTLSATNASTSTPAPPSSPPNSSAVPSAPPNTTISSSPATTTGGTPAGASPAPPTPPPMSTLSSPNGPGSGLQSPGSGGANGDADAAASNDCKANCVSFAVVAAVAVVAVAGVSVGVCLLIRRMPSAKSS